MRFQTGRLLAALLLSALQILVHPSNPVDTLTVPQLDAIDGSELRAGENRPSATREFLNYLPSNERQTEVAQTGSLPLDRTQLLRARKRLGL